MNRFWVHALRVFLGVIFVSAGASKLGPYPSLIGPVQLIDQLEPYGLRLFGQFIAISELGVGVLLLTRRFATVGAIMLVPMLLSILAFTISLNWQGTPWIVATMLLFNLALLAHDHRKWAGLIAKDGAAPVTSPEPSKRGLLVRAWPVVLAALLLVPLLAARNSMLFRVAAFFVVSCFLLTALIQMDRNPA